MDVKQAIRQRRTIRRFENKPISETTLRSLVDMSRLYASGGNRQPIRYIAVNTQKVLDEIFPLLRWAAYLPDFKISLEQRPMAYIILTCEEKHSVQFDVGAAATTLMLAAEGEGLGTCCLGAFDSKRLKDILHLDESTEPALVIALGYPDQCSKAVDYTGDVRYYEDETGCLCVPKRKIEDVLTWII